MLIEVAYKPTKVTPAVSDFIWSKSLTYVIPLHIYTYICIPVSKLLSSRLGYLRSLALSCLFAQFSQSILSISVIFWPFKSQHVISICLIVSSVSTGTFWGCEIDISFYSYSVVTKGLSNPLCWSIFSRETCLKPIISSHTEENWGFMTGS